MPDKQKRQSPETVHESERFEDLAKKLFVVPKSEVDELEKAAKAKRKSRPKKKQAGATEDSDGCA